MANTKIPVELSSTPSIVDNGNATAITIDGSENATFAGTISSGAITADGLTVDSVDAVGFINGGGYGATNTAKLRLRGGYGDNTFINGFGIKTTRTAAYSNGATLDFIKESRDVESGKALTITEGGDIYFYEDTGTTAKLFWDASAESLEIGSIQTTTNFPLIVKSGTNNHAIAIEEASGGETWQLGVDIDGDLGFYNSGSTTASVTFDDSGNLLVGQTTASSGTVGTSLRADGRTFFCADDNYAAHFNRNTGHGAIAHFAKDDNIIGSISSKYSDLAIYSTASGHQGIRMHSVGILPTDNAGELEDNTTDLGSLTYRFKDLFLSGGAYLGGTGSANKLDDYEEGTFTVGFTGASISAGNATGNYTKIGRVVYYSYYSTASTISNASGVAELTGLPFTVKSGVTSYQPFYTAHNTFFGGSTSIGVEGYPNVSGTSIRFIERGTTNNVTFVNGVTRFLMVAGFYLTDA